MARKPAAQVPSKRDKLDKRDKSDKSDKGAPPAPPAEPVPLTPVTPKIGEGRGNLKGRSDAFTSRRGKTP